MIPVMTTCQHCGTPVTAARKTRKYCSDACKQAAFYQRSAMAYFKPTHNDTATINGKTEDGSNTNIADSATTAQGIPPAPELFPNAVDSEVSDIQQQTGKQLVSAIPGEGLLRPSDGEPEPCGRAVSKEESAGEHTDSASQLPPAKEPRDRVYSWLLRSLDSLTFMDADILEIFANPERYYDKHSLEQVKWVAVRIRSITETLLQLDNHIISREIFCEIAKALSAVCHTEAYKLFSPEFRFNTGVRELAENMLEFTSNIGDRHRFQLSFDTKVMLIAARYELSALVPFVHFDNLGFSR